MDIEKRNKLIEDLKEKYPIEEQVKFDEFNINEKLSENMILKMRYQELYDNAKFEYDYLNNKLEILIGKRYDYYRFESDRNLTKSEIEQYYLKGDKKIRKVNDILESYKIKKDFFKICVNAIGELYWRMKVFADNSV